MKETLRRLEQLVPTLGTLVTKEDNHHVIIKTCDGEMKGTNLINVPSVAVARWTMTKGTMLEQHQHVSKEYLIIIHGCINVKVGKKTTKLQDSDCIIIDNNIPHSSIALEDTEFIGIVIPSDTGFPK